MNMTTQLVLELGSGANPTVIPNRRIIHLDMVDGPHVEIVCNLEHGIPFPANVFDHILAVNMIEHLEDTVAIMNEMHRVLKPGGEAFIRVPTWGSPAHRIDPTHKKGFTEKSFDFFDDSRPFGKENGVIYTQRRWRILRQDINSSDLSLSFEIKALKPGEEPRELVDLFGVEPQS